MLAARAYSRSAAMPSSTWAWAAARSLEAGEPEPRVLDGTHGALEPDGCNLVAPRRHRADAVPRAGLDNGEEIALFPHGGGVEGEEGVVGREVAHSLSFRGRRRRSPEPISTRGWGGG